MSHHKHIAPKNEVLFWQDIWSFFTEKGFVIFPSKDYLDKGYVKKIDKFLVPQIDGLAVEKIDNFVQAVETINNLLDKISSKNEKIQAEWNFFGKPEDKEKYIHYLQDQLWRNQSSQDWTNILNYSQILEEPILLLNTIEKLEFEINSAGDFFDSQTQETFLKIDKTLQKWQYNPFQTLGGKGTFEWFLEVENYTITGFVEKVNNQLYHKINFLPAFGRRVDTLE